MSFRVYLPAAAATAAVAIAIPVAASSQGGPQTINLTEHNKGSTFNFDLTEALELGYLIDLAESLVVGGMARTESRGGHFRDDYPTRDDANWLKHSLVRRAEDGTVTLDYKPVQLGRYEPMERKY